MLGYREPVRMSTIERLFVQIFERKRRIIDQASQQVCFFDNYLRSKLIINGIAPPTWLRNPEFHSLPSDPKELDKEDLLSEALIPQSKYPYSGISHDLYGQLDVKSDDENCSYAVHGAVNGFNNDYRTASTLPVVPECSVNKGWCASSGVCMADSSAISPLHQAEDVPDNDPSLSLARMQRSRPRQKAMELRNSAKLVKMCSRNENNRDAACPDFSLKSNNEEEVQAVPHADGINEGCIVREVGLTGHSEKQNSFCCTESITGPRISAQRPNHAVNSIVGKEDGSFFKDAEKHSSSHGQEEVQCKLPSNVESKTLDQEIPVQKVTNLVRNDKNNASLETYEEECQKGLISQDEIGKTLNDMLSIREKCLVPSDQAAHSFSYCNKTNGDNSSSRNSNIILQTSVDSLPATLVGDQDDEMRMHLPMGKFNEELDMAKTARLDFEESTLDRDVHGLDPSIAVAEFPALHETHVSVITDENICNPLVKVPHTNSEDQRRVTISAKAPDSILCNQNADFSFDNWVSLSKTVFCSNRKWSQKSLVRQSSTYDIEVQSSQKKRRKIEGQQANALAMSTSLMENLRDSISRKNVSESCIDGVPKCKHSPNHQQNEGGHINFSTGLSEQSTCTDPCFVRSKLEFGSEEGKQIPEGNNSHAETHFTFSLNEFGESPVSALTELGCRDSNSLLLDRIRAEDPVNTVSDVMQKSSSIDSQLSFNLTNDHGIESAKYEGCTDRIRKEIASSLGIKARLSCSSPPQLCQHMDVGSTSDTMSEFQGLHVHPDSFQPWVTEEKIGIGVLKLPTCVQHPTALEKVHQSASINSPACSLKILGLREINALYRSVPNGLEGLCLESYDTMKDGNNRPRLDSLPNPKIHSAWNVKNSYRSPVRTLWDDITLKYGSSGKRVSSNPELPCIDEEIEREDELHDTFHKVSEVITSSVRRGSPADIVNIANPTALVSQVETLSERYSLETVKTDISFSGAQKKIIQKAEKQNGCRRKYTSKGKENVGASLGANGANRTISFNNCFSRPKLSQETGARKGGPTFSGTKPPRNNILSNVTSFIPLVHQKQAAAAVKGKRDFNVKALEAAEVKKRLEQKRENERKMKKEALKVQREKAQRERLEQENMKQLELQKKRKEEEKKRKETNMEAKKRQREEAERKEERKRKHLDDTRKQLVGHGENFCAKKDNKAIRCQTTGGKAEGSKDLKDERDMNKEFNHRQCCVLRENPATESNTAVVPTIDEITDSTVIQDSQASSESGCSPKVNCNMINQKEDDNLCLKTSTEQSYDISPYKESDDEDEDGDDGPHKKYVPSWASKQHLSMVVSSQQIVIPETIFPPQSFCNITEALMPRQYGIT